MKNINLLGEFITLGISFCPQQCSFWRPLWWFFRVRFAPLSNGMRASENHPRKTHVFWSKLGSRTPNPKKMWKDTKSTRKWWPERNPVFNKNLRFSLCFFCWFWDESRWVFFLRFGGQSAPNRDYFGTLLQLYYTKVGKLKTSVSPWPNTTFSSFEGLGRNILGDFFQFFFWYGFRVMILRFFWEIGGPAGAPKTTFSWLFWGHILDWFSMNFRGHPESHVRQRGEVIWTVLGHLSNRLLTSESRHSSSSYIADGYW